MIYQLSIVIYILVSIASSIVWYLTFDKVNSKYNIIKNKKVFEVSNIVVSVVLGTRAGKYVGMFFMDYFYGIC